MSSVLLASVLALTLAVPLVSTSGAQSQPNSQPPSRVCGAESPAPDTPLGQLANKLHLQEADCVALPRKPVRQILTSFQSSISRAPKADPTQALIGDGFNTLLAVGRGSCVAFDPNQANQYLTKETGAHQNVNFYLHAIDTVEQLLNELSLSVSAEYNSGATEADVSVQYFNQYRYSKYTRYLLVRVLVINEAEGLTKPTATELAKQALHDGDDQFFDRCGNRFVRGRVTGGDFAAVIRYQAENESQLNTLNAQMHAAVGSFTASATMSQKISSINSFTQREVTIFRKGTSDTIPSTVDGIEAYATTFPAKIADSNNAVVIGLWLQDYRTLFNVPKSIESQTNAFQSLADSHSAVMKVLSGVAYIRTHQADFPPLPDDILSRVAETEKLEATIRDRATVCADSLLDICQKPFPVTIPIQKLPEKIEWTAIDPANPGDQPLATSSVGDFGIASTGCWVFHSPTPDKVVCVPGLDGGGVAYKTTPISGGGTSTPYTPLLGTVAVPANSRIDIKLFDSYYPDNSSDAHNPLKVGFFEFTGAVAP